MTDFLFCFIGFWLMLMIALPLYLWSDRSGRQGSDRHEREVAEVRDKLHWIAAHPGERIDLGYGRTSDRVKEHLPEVMRLVGRWGGCPDDIVDRIDKLERGRGG